MLKRKIFISFSCFLVAIFSLLGEAKTTAKITDDLSNTSNQEPQHTVPFSVINRQILGNSPPVLANNFSSDRAFNQPEPKMQAQLTTAVRGNSNYMTLTPTGKTNARGNPLYHLNLYVNGQVFKKYETVSGRAFTQKRDRDRSGTEAPLPDGRYAVAKASVPGTIAEAGDRFLPIQPLFQTGRSALGIHYDPSYEKKNGEDGTSGCIALTDRDKLTEVLHYVRTYQPKYLEVQIR